MKVPEAVARLLGSLDLEARLTLLRRMLRVMRLLLVAKSTVIRLI